MAEREKGYRKETVLIHGKFRTAKWDYIHHVIPPLTKSTTFRLDSTQRGHEGFMSFNSPLVAREDEPPVYVYDRLGEPTIDMLEDMMKEAEGGEAGVAFSCGMSAISTTLLVLNQAGTKIVAHRTLYGCTYSLLSKWLPRYGIKTQFIDLTDIEALKAAITPETRVVYTETPANPTLEVVDLEKVRGVIDDINRTRKKEEKVWLVVDNTFATPWAQRPLEHGADIVVESLTKNVGGFGVDMGGMAVVPAELIPDLKLLRKDLGGVLSPSAAWNIMVFGLGTLALRMRRQQETALKVAKFLESQDIISKVHYPGLESFPYREAAMKQMRDPYGEFAPGIMIYFEFGGDLDLARRRSQTFVDTIAAEAYSITMAVSLGMTKTLLEAPGLMTHSALPPEEQSKAGIHPGGVRMSIGIEHPDDLIRDLENALNKAKAV